MQVIKGDDFSYYDVDDTLVSWAYPGVNGPYIEDFKEFIDPISSATWHLLPIQKTIESLKSNKKAGGTIIVWSAGGWQWAEAVVKTLGLEEYVDCVMSKPNRYYDDIPSAEFMGTRYDFSKEIK